MMGQWSENIVLLAATLLHPRSLRGSRLGRSAAAQSPQAAAIATAPPPAERQRPLADEHDAAPHATDKPARFLKFNKDAFRRTAVMDWTMSPRRNREEFRLIKRRVLSRAAAGSDETGTHATVIMVTSARPQAGKTFTAFNLAVSIAGEINRHVLLVDADGSEDGLSRYFSDADAPGIFDVAADPALSIGDAILRTEIPRLSVVLAGKERQLGPELLASERMRSILDELAQRYADRVILVDAPPCLVSSIPSVLAHVVGQIAFVVEADCTQRAEIEAACELLGFNDRISLILNKTRISTTDSFGSYRYDQSDQ